MASSLHISIPTWWEGSLDRFSSPTFFTHSVLLFPIKTVAQAVLWFSWLKDPWTHFISKALFEIFPDLDSFLVLHSQSSCYWNVRNYLQIYRFLRRGMLLKDLHPLDYYSFQKLFWFYYHIFTSPISLVNRVR